MSLSIVIERHNVSLIVKITFLKSAYFVSFVFLFLLFYSFVAREGGVEKGHRAPSFQNLYSEVEPFDEIY